MSGGERPDEEVTCPSCGSERTVCREVAEHAGCGYIRPVDSFERHGGCPKCDVSIKRRDEFERVGKLWTCMDCGRSFDARAMPTDPAERPDGGERPSSVGASARQQLQSLATVAVVLLVISTAVVGAVGTSPFAQEASQADQKSWNEYESVVIFRNDDIQPYYRSETMKAVDSIFVEEGVPVTQGVIPAIGGQEMNKEMEVCRYLRQQTAEHPEIFDVALHGYQHKEVNNYSGGSEFGGVPYQVQREKISNGANAIQRCVGERPDTFIPPLNTYDRNTVRALNQENITVLSEAYWSMDAEYNRTQPFEENGVYHVPNTHSFVNWDDPNTKFYSEQELKRQFDRSYENNSLHVQMMHYPMFNTTERRESLRGLIEHMKSKSGVKFMTVSEFAQKSRQGDIERTEDGWRIYEREGTGNPETLTDRATRMTERYIDEARSAFTAAMPARTVRLPSGGERR